MKQKPLPGDVVRLNDHGMQQIGGLRSAEAIRQAQRMTITGVYPNMTEPQETYPIEVDQPLIGRFLLTHVDVDLIERPAAPAPNRLPPPPMSLEEAIALGHATVYSDDSGTGVRVIKIG